MRALLTLALILVLAAGCGGIDSGDTDAGAAADGAATDAKPTDPADANQPADSNLADAGVDAPPLGPDNREVTAAAGTMNGGDYTIDFQLGHWHSQAPMAGGDMTSEGAAAIKP